MGRGTKFNRSMSRDQGVLSGTTLATFPSGSTIARGASTIGGTLTVAGVTSSSTVYASDTVVCTGVDTGSGTAYKITTGETVWTGTTGTITHGLTTLSTIVGSYGVSGVTLNGYLCISPTSVITTGVSFAVRTSVGSMCGGGSSVQWMAIGV